jgi:hypothetical protein
MNGCMAQCVHVCVCVAITGTGGPVWFYRESNWADFLFQFCEINDYELK